MTNNYSVLILAAGRGSRLLSLTDDRPKGLVNLRSRPLVEWQILALKKVGLDQISIVTGYMGEKYEELGYPVITNPEWSRTNMVGSLACALDTVRGGLVLCYSDIIYHTCVIEKLMACRGDFVVAYDKAWLSLWSDRFEDPLSDAETFKINESQDIMEIGKKPVSIGEIQGQFMGLMKLSPKGLTWVRDLLASDSSYRFNLDTTTMIQILINQGFAIKGCAMEGNWCEIDDAGDLKVAEERINTHQLKLGDLVDDNLDYRTVGSRQNRDRP